LTEEGKQRIKEVQQKISEEERRLIIQRKEEEENVHAALEEKLT